MQDLIERGLNGLQMAGAEYGDAQRAYIARLVSQLPEGTELRTAAEVMAAEVAPLNGRAAEYYLDRIAGGTTRAMVIIGSERAGPAARQVFTAAR